MERTLGVVLAALLTSAAMGVAVTAHAGDELTVEKLVEAFKDNYTGYYYQNLTNMEKFVAALDDPYAPARYGAIMDRSRFSALKLEEEGADYGVADGNIDFLATPGLPPESEKTRRTAALRGKLCTN